MFTWFFIIPTTTAIINTTITTTTFTTTTVIIVVIRRRRWRQRVVRAHIVAGHARLFDRIVDIYSLGYYYLFVLGNREYREGELFENAVVSR